MTVWAPVRVLLRSGYIRGRGDGAVLGWLGHTVLRDHGDGHVLILGLARSGKGPGKSSLPSSGDAARPRGRLRDPDRCRAYRPPYRPMPTAIDHRANDVVRWNEPLKASLHDLLKSHAKPKVAIFQRHAQNGRFWDSRPAPLPCPELLDRFYPETIS